MARKFASGRAQLDLGALRRADLDDDFGRRFVSFALVGAASTAISLGLFLLVCDPIGAIAANAIAVTATFVANAWAHARYTAGRRRPHWRRAFAVYAGSLLLTSGALALVDAAGGGLSAQLAVLVATWSVAAIVRFVTVAGTREEVVA